MNVTLASELWYFVSDETVEQDDVGIDVGDGGRDRAAVRRPRDLPGDERCPIAEVNHRA